MKRIISACGAFVCMFFFAAHIFADTETYGGMNVNGELSVKVITDFGSDTLYTIYLTEKDTELRENESGLLRNMLLLEQLSAASEGNPDFNTASLKISVPGILRDKVYKVTAGGGELDGEELYVIYPSEDVYNAALTELRKASSGDIGEVLKKHQSSSWILDLQCDEYKDCMGKVNENLAAIIKDNPDVTDGFYKACALAQISGCTKENVFAKLFRYKSILGIDYPNEFFEKNTNVLDAFYNLKSDKAENPVTTVEEFKTLLRKSEALGLLNSAARDTVIDVLKKYNDVFLLDFEGDFRSVDAYELSKKMVVSNSLYTSVAQVMERFNDSINSLNSPIVAHRSPGGGGGGGGTASSAGIVSGRIDPEVVEAVSPTDVFYDIDEVKWGKPYIQYLFDRKIMSGDGNKMVRPGAFVKREEFLKMLLEAINPEVPDNEFEPEFFDVDENEWYAKYVHNAAALGIVKGIDDKVFGTGSSITRQDAAVMICRAAEAGKKLIDERSPEKVFADWEDISDYAVSSVRSLQMADIISGYETGCFLPHNTITRAEAAKLIYSTLKNFGDL